MIVPEWAARMCGRTAWVARIVPKRFVSKRVWKSLRLGGLFVKSCCFRKYFVGEFFLFLPEVLEAAGDAVTGIVHEYVDPSVDSRCAVYLLLDVVICDV